MSTTTPRARGGRAPLPMPRPGLAEKKRLGEPTVMVPAYDPPAAHVADAVGVDLVLVGDGAANVVLGYDSTVPVSVDELIMLGAAVRRGLRTPLMISDMPFGSYEASNELAIANAQRFVKEAGADAVKLEGGGRMVERAQAIIESGIPVMGHVGLTPQTATALGGYKAQGRTADAAHRVAADALALQDAGCFSIVFEAIPAAGSDGLMPRLHQSVVIGIGAGAATDGQVLVFHDLLGIREGAGARFVKRYGDLMDEMVHGVSAYADDVREHRYPASEHTYSIDPGELADFKARLS